MRFPNRLVLSAMAGINDWEFARNFQAGFLILGGFNADRKAMEAGIRALKRGRKEFIFDDPISGIEDQLKKAVEDGRNKGINIRSSSLKGYVDSARLASEYGAVVEINAHCRQPEFLEIGCGQSLMFNPDRLVRIVDTVSKYSEVIVKIRGGLELDYTSISERIFEAGAFMIHIDAMVPGGGADYEIVREISRMGNVIGNNSIRDAESAKRMIDSGAKLVSLARMVLRDKDIFKKLLRDDVLASSIEVI